MHHNGREDGLYEKEKNTFADAMACGSNMHCACLCYYYLNSIAGAYDFKSTDCIRCKSLCEFRFLDGNEFSCSNIYSSIYYDLLVYERTSYA